MPRNKIPDALRGNSLDECAEQLLRFGQLFHEFRKDNYHCPPSAQPDRNELFKISKILREEQRLLRLFRTGEFKDSALRRFISYRKGRKFYPHNVILRVVSGLSFLQIFEDTTGYSPAHLAKYISVSEQFDEILAAKRIIGYMVSVGHLVKEQVKHSVYNCTVRLHNRVIDLMIVGDSDTRNNQEEQTERKIRNRVNHEVADFLNSLQVLTPRDMYKKVEEYGFIGQERSRKILSTLAYRHLKRIRQIHLNGIKESDLPPRENILCMGNTGVGKTFLATTLFADILKLPCVIIDITNFTSAGYVGRDTPEILQSLIDKADGNIALAEIGCVIVDEICKIASAGYSSQLFAGDRTGRDVGGKGVQQSLLKMLENWTTDLAISGHPYRGKKVSFRTNNVLFIGVGAFSGFDLCTGKNRSPLGFGAVDKRRTNRRDIPTARDFGKWGFAPEFIGRFHQIVRFDDLSKEQMRKILDNTLRKYRVELAMDNIGLEIEESVKDILIDDAVEMGTGARALSCIQPLENALFHLYSTQGSGRTLKLSVDKDSEIKSVIKKRTGTILVEGRKETVLSNGEEHEEQVVDYC